MTPYLEIGGDYRQVVPGVCLLELPLPFSLGLINTYLVRLPEGYLLIDCGMETEACFDALTRAMEGLSLEWRSIRQILLTHIHPDHMGLAPKLLALTGARLLLHQAELKLLNEIVAGDTQRRFQKEVLQRGGVPSEVVAQIGATLADVQKNFQPLQPDWILRGGETVETAVGPLDIIWTPGHSPGHICLYSPERRILFSGDHILEHITPNIGWQHDHDALDEFLKSLDRTARLEVDLILPSHGAPFTGHRDWIRKTTEHHAERCRRIVEGLNSGAQTAHDLVGRLWDRHLSPFHHRFAIFEVLAHLEYLERRGRLTCRPENGVCYWRVTG